MSCAAPARFTDGMASIGDLLSGRYRLGPLLGEGGMAVVHRGRDEVLGREVAVKLLRAQYAADEEFVRRFRQEARNAASLSHPSIAPVFDTGVDGEDQYIVMQLVEGQDLDQVLDERGALPVAEALRIGMAVAEALQAAHDRGIIHRDVKPGNILLTSEGEVRVVDFGIARALGDARTTTAGLMLGSVQYCSPEQVLGEPVGVPSDVYSLGIVLYELLTGVRPFDGPSPASVALRRLHEPPIPPSEQADLPPGLDEIVLRALARRPDDRFASAASFAAAIREWWRARRRASPATSSTPRLAIPRGEPAGEAAAAMTIAVPAPGAGGSIRRGRGPRDGAAGFTPHAPSSRPRADRDDSRPRGAALWVLPLAALVLVAAALWTVRGIAPGDRGGVLGATGSPAASDAGLAPGGSQSLAPPATPSSSPSPSPSPSAVPTPPPTPDPTPRPSLPPTPAPTPVATDPPAAPPTADSPGAVVARFYDLVETHEFDAAAALWSDRMRAEYPPDEYIDGRFSRTTRIDLLRNEVLSLDADSGTAVVAVDLVEHRTVEPTPRRFTGRWDMVLTDDGWRMDEPHF
jgi:serine/threonine protein kinase